jgi:uncharacterized protein (DUF486 family)
LYFTVANAAARKGRETFPAGRWAGFHRPAVSCHVYKKLFKTMSPYIAPILLLVCSNVFMTFAWYGQLKFPSTALWATIAVSWGIALFEYCLAVPANRIGHQVYSAAQLKTMQEVITLIVFAIFSVTYLGESLRWNHAVSFLFLCGAAFFAFHKWN